MRTPIAILALLVASPWVAAEDKKDDAKLDLFPLAKGTKWEYSATADGVVKDLVQDVTEIAPGKKGERDLVTVESIIDGAKFAEEFSADDKAVYRHAMQGLKLETPMPMVQYPHKVGAKWKAAIKIGTDEAEASFEAMKAEEIAVAAGKYTAHPIVMVVDIKGKKIISKNWYADGVGMVKQEVDFGEKKVVLELKKFAKGK